MKPVGILLVAHNAEPALVRVLRRNPPDVMAEVEEVFVFDDASQHSTYQAGCAWRVSW